ncbi:uracil-DNA glycosylase [bacterium]|nr:uracil-DNA glycosylase [bacterium]
MKLKTGQQIKQKNRLRKVCVWFDVCPLKRSYEQGKLDRKWIENYCWADYSKCVRKKMEEQGIYHPDNMMPDGTIDERL